MPSSPPLRLLFLCTRNACRSQMAEIWARHLFPGQVVAASAGTRPGTPDPRMLQVMVEAGAEVAGARSKSLEEMLGRDWDLVVTLCDAAAEECPQLPGARRTLHRPFPDPAAATGSEEEVLALFRGVRDGIRSFVEDLVLDRDL